jgi:hypothetical protein
VPKIETCDHWIGYRIPTDAAICPGCGRRHPVRVQPAASPLVVDRTHPAPAAPPAAVPSGERRRRRHGPLLRTARGSRWLLALTAWLATAFGLAAGARYVIGLDDVADDVSEDVPGRVADAALGLGLATAAAFALAAAAIVTWSRRAHHNLEALEVRSSWASGWALGGWLVPGRRARAEKIAVDALWRDTSPVVASLPHRGSSRRPVSRVVLHWWSLWLAVPAAGLLAAALAGGAEDLQDERAVLGLAGAALTVGAARALYDVVGLVTIAQAHLAESVLRDRAAARVWTDDDDGWADADPAESVDDDGADSADLEPLRR